SYQKVTLPITALGKAWCDDATDGFIKLISKDGKVCGAHIVSKEASSLIHTVLVAVQNGVGVEQLKASCFAHPTYSEGLFDAIMRL
ncbi:dihydrolipoyl dehydrogenase, partial [bacterium]|nr:dihydrolipoyl dehydrogenase [bacterium]